ncbi:hypothetical protein PMAYCL1PPCAC_11734, partial [Pristionchus mayeri]
SPVSVLEHSRVVLLQEFLRAAEDNGLGWHCYDSSSQPIRRGTDVESIDGGQRTDEKEEQSDHF